jgi:hypothetical protein
MFLRIHQLTVCLLLMALAASLHAAALRDIPGEGDLRCMREACPDSRGTVTSSPAGLVSGSLLGDTPMLAASLTTADPMFLTFSGGGTPLGPLGLNPLFQPESNRDSRIPVSGQPITLDLTNGTGIMLASIALYLEIPQTVVTAPFPVQGDGLSFGVWCNTGLEEPRNCAEHIDLLTMPTGPGILNAADITPSAGPEATFGDLLRFTNVNLAPGGTARFTFFITDRKATLDPSTGGSIEGASPSFNLEIVPTAVPEPGTSALGAAALLALIAASRMRSSHGPLS